VGLDDYRLFRFLGAMEVAAVTPQLRFRPFRTGAGWSPTVEFDRILLAEHGQLLRRAKQALDHGRISEDQINLIFYHVLWTRVTALFPSQLHYRQERRSE